MTNHKNLILLLVALIVVLSGNISSQTVKMQVTLRPPLTSDGGISAGISWGDFNKDNFPDIFIANWGGQDNFLYQNDQKGGFIKIENDPVVTTGGNSSGASWGDYDNDGYPDLFVTNQNNENNFLFHNQGDGTFKQITEGDIVTDYGDSYSAVWADYNNDGWLDLYVANANQPNFLYAGKGDGTFKKITNDPCVNFVGNNRGASWGDYDNDGYIDLFVAERNNLPSRLFRNIQGVRFEEITNTPMSSDSGKSNGASWGDFDNDGYLDLFVANGAFFITGENNYLYRNNGAGNFEKISNSTITFDSAKSMSGCWSDFDNDGDLDLFVTTYIHNNILFENLGGGEFDRRNLGVFTDFAGFSTGTGAADYDLDGDVDLVIANWENQNNNIIINTQSDNNWIEVKCVGVNSNRDGIGTRIKIVWKADDVLRKTYHQLLAGYGFRSQDDLKIHAGVNDAEVIDSIIINWPGSNMETLTSVKANQLIIIKENQGIVDYYKPETKVEPQRTITQVYQDLKDSTQSVLKMVDSLCIGQESEINCSEASLIQLGYTLLYAGKKDEARSIFIVASEKFSNSANVFDCIAEVSETMRDSAKVVEASRIVIQLLEKDKSVSDDFKKTLENNANYRLKHYSGN